MLCVFINAGVLAGTPDDMEDIFDPAINPPDAFEAPPSPSLPPAQGRQKMAAAVKPFDASHFLSRLHTLTPGTFDVIRDVRHFYAVPDGAQDPGVESDAYRTGLKRRADDISRSQYEVYSFSTKNNLSEAAVDELLEMLTNVCTSHLHFIKFHVVIRSNIACGLSLQVRFCSSDITCKTMKTLDHQSRLAMTPDYEMYCVDLKEGKVCVIQ